MQTKIHRLLGISGAVDQPLWKRSSRACRGSALLITLAALVLVTIIVISYAVVTRLESSMARSNFEAESAKQLATMAVDEVQAKLIDNIPLNAQWAAAPGRLYNAKTGTFTDLHSGHVGTDSVALNSQLYGASSKYPIVPANNDYTTPDPMKVDWIYVLQDGTRSTDSGYSPGKTNPIVGRYAYWTDVENGKVNLNTAGKAQTTYETSSYGSTANDNIQNLSGHPSRVDLSKLDSSGGTISSSASLLTYNFAASSLWYGGDGTDNVFGVLNANPSLRAVGQGLKRFNSIWEWSQISGIQRDMIEANKFYLTTQANTPELNPWGQNKIWMQTTPGPQLGKLFYPGNALNLPNPVYPYYPSWSKSGLNEELSPTYRCKIPESRYYVYPATVSPTPPATPAFTMQNDSWAHSLSTAMMQQYIDYMMTQFNRSDWPGMPAKSFVEKYGTKDCEDLAVNLLALYLSAVDGYGYGPGPLESTVFEPNDGGGSVAFHDGHGVYGSNLVKYTESDGTIRRIPTISGGPYIDKIQVTFSPTSQGAVSGKRGPQMPQTAGQNSENVEIQPNIEYTFPRSLSYDNDFLSDAGSGAITYPKISSVEIIATGTLPNGGGPHTYSGTSYSYLYANDVPNTSTGYLGGEGYGDVVEPYSPSSGTPKRIAHGTGTRNASNRVSVSLDPLYAGPFDPTKPVDVQIKFRVASIKIAVGTGEIAHQVIPADYFADPTTLEDKFLFDGNFPNDLNDPIVTKTYQVIDPRVYGKLSDWTLEDGDASIYVSQYHDPLTGVTGDDSKFAWPNVGAATRPIFGLSGEPTDSRVYQTASNITGFPGVGWLSVLPTNCESSPVVPWRTVSLEPNTSGHLPDWLLLDIFTMAYEQTFLSQTQGKLNINTGIEPFGFSRLKPLEALLIPSTDNATTDATAIAQDFATYKGATPTGTTLPAGIYLYGGQICEVPSMKGSGTDQWSREALARDVAGLVTTKASDFRIYVIAQTLAKNSFDATVAGSRIAEQRLEAVISRRTDVGPDGVPGTADDMAGPDHVVGTSDDLTFQSSTGAPISKLNYGGVDPALENLTGRPPFRYQISEINFNN
jgi:hypothetical protein